MKRRIRTAAAFSAAALLLAGSSCGGSRTEAGTQAATTTATQMSVDTDKQLEEEIDWEGMADIEKVDAADEEGTGSLYEPGKKAGLVKVLCYYDIVASEPEISEIFATRYGGTMETEITSSMEYFDKLSVLIASGLSPDLVRYDWAACPDGISKGRYIPLDDWLDIDSPLWVEEKSVIESFNYLGKHYYFPSDIQTNFAIIYNKRLVAEEDMEDPMDLYFQGRWTWDEFEDMMKKWSQKGDDYIGFTGGSWSAMMFANTTGTKTIDFTGTDIVNNLRSAPVFSTMEWLTGLKQQGLIGNGFIHPGEAFVDGKLLFLGMGLEWGYESAQETAFKKNLDAEIAAVPFPRCPTADKYYLSSDTFGYMVPSGAENVQGAVQWILSSRLYETDPDILAARRAEMMSTDPIYYAKCPSCKYDFAKNGKEELENCPECGSARKEKYKPTYSEQQLDIIDDMTNPEKFGLVFDGAVGFNNDFYNIFVGSEDTVFDGPLYFGLSYTQKIEEMNNTIEAYLQPYRDLLKVQ